MRAIVLSSALTATLILGGFIGWTYWDRSVQAAADSRREFAEGCQALASLSAVERADMLSKLSTEEKRDLLNTINECMKAV